MSAVAGYDGVLTRPAADAGVPPRCRPWQPWEGRESARLAGCCADHDLLAELRDCCGPAQLSVDPVA